MRTRYLHEKQVPVFNDTDEGSFGIKGGRVNLVQNLVVKNSVSLSLSLKDVMVELKYFFLSF